MNAAVIYESTFGLTRAVAEAIAAGLGGAPALPVEEAGAVLSAELLVIGSPTHMHAMPTERSRRLALAEAARRGCATPHAGASPRTGVREWLRELSELPGTFGASFDTRTECSPLLAGEASRAIARRMRAHDLIVLDEASFLLRGPLGPPAPGELERAERWGAAIASAAARHHPPCGSAR